MNKFLSIIFLLTCFFVSATAQTDNNTVLSSMQFVRADGTPIPDGSILIVDSAESNPFGDIIMHSGLYVRNTTDKPVTASIEVNISSLDAGSLLCCFPQACQSYASTGIYETPSGPISATAKPQDLRTEWSCDIPNYEGQVTARFRIKIYQDNGTSLLGYGPTVSVCFVSPSLTGIKSATISTPLIGIYNLHGQRLASPQKGLNIFRYSDGSTRKVWK